jgi:hypothetical protein
MTEFISINLFLTEIFLSIKPDKKVLFIPNRLGLLVRETYPRIQLNIRRNSLFSIFLVLLLSLNMYILVMNQTYLHINNTNYKKT